jgi:hypothetical protein
MHPMVRARRVEWGALHLLLLLLVAATQLVATPAAAEPGLRVLSYNLQMLPGTDEQYGGTSGDEDRAEKIAQRILAAVDPAGVPLYDVLIFQEVFDDTDNGEIGGVTGARDILIRHLSKLYPNYIYKLYHPDSGLTDNDSGLMIFSRFPFQDIPNVGTAVCDVWSRNVRNPGGNDNGRQAAFLEYETYISDVLDSDRECRNDPNSFRGMVGDCSADKGVFYVRLLNPADSRVYHVLGTHLQSSYSDAETDIKDDPGTAQNEGEPVGGDWREYNTIRKNQLQTVSDLADSCIGTNFAIQNVIIAGDFNIDGDLKEPHVTPYAELFGDGDEEYPIAEGSARTENRSEWEYHFSHIVDDNPVFAALEDAWAFGMIEPDKWVSYNPDPEGQDPERVYFDDGFTSGTTRIDYFLTGSFWTTEGFEGFPNCPQHVSIAHNLQGGPNTSGAGGIRHAKAGTSSNYSDHMGINLEFGPSWLFCAFASPARAALDPWPEFPKGSNSPLQEMPLPWGGVHWYKITDRGPRVMTMNPLYYNPPDPAHDNHVGFEVYHWKNLSKAAPIWNADSRATGPSFYCLQDLNCIRTGAQGQAVNKVTGVPCTCDFEEMPGVRAGVYNFIDPPYYVKVFRDVGMREVNEMALYNFVSSPLTCNNQATSCPLGAFEPYDNSKDPWNVWNAAQADSPEKWFEFWLERPTAPDSAFLVDWGSTAVGVNQPTIRLTIDYLRSFLPGSGPVTPAQLPSLNLAILRADDADNNGVFDELPTQVGPTRNLNTATWVPKGVNNDPSVRYTLDLPVGEVSTLLQNTTGGKQKVYIKLMRANASYTGFFKYRVRWETNMTHAPGAAYARGTQDIIISETTDEIDLGLFSINTYDEVGTFLEAEHYWQIPDGYRFLPQGSGNCQDHNSLGSSEGGVIPFNHVLYTGWLDQWGLPLQTTQTVRFRNDFRVTPCDNDDVNDDHGVTIFDAQGFPNGPEVIEQPAGFGGGVYSVRLHLANEVHRQWCNQDSDCKHLPEGRPTLCCPGNVCQVANDSTGNGNWVCP